jgi:uncharacterized membrane protein
MQYHPLPQPHEVSQREKEDAMGAYLMMFAATAIGLPLPILNLIAAIVYYFVNRSKGRFVRFHALQSLYSQITVSLLNSALVIWAVTNLIKEYSFSQTFWGLLITAGVINLVYFIFSLVGAVRSRKGRFYYFLFFGQLAYQQVYMIRENDDQEQPVNLPPKL